MLLRNAREVGALIADGRRRLRWSQFELARRAGVSRQWVSQVENGKTTVEFDLVLAALHALGYALYAQSKDWQESNQPERVKTGVKPGGQTGLLQWIKFEDTASRTPLTRQGRSLATQRSQRGKATGDE